MKKIGILPTLLTLGNGVCGFAAIVCASKIGRGDVASIVAVNHPDFLVAMLGSLMAGAAVATANAGLTATELRRQLMGTESKVLFADTVSKQEYALSAQQRGTRAAPV